MSDSREQFEAWATSDEGPLFPSQIGQNAAGYYVCSEADVAWSSWQASRAQPERKLTDAEIRELAHKHLNGTGDHCIINFARSLLAAQPAAATVPDLASELLLAVIGLKRVIELAVTTPSGKQFAYIETRNKSFVHVVTALEMAEAVIAKCATQPPAAQAQDDGENMHTQSTHHENVSKQSPAIDMSCSENRRRAGLVYSRTCPICKLGPCQRKAKQ